EAERAVERDRLAHRGQRVEAHLRVPDPARVAENLFGELAAEPLSAIGAADVEPLHFGDSLFEPPQRDAARRVASAPGDEEDSGRRRVGAGQAGKLGLEALEAEIDPERGFVLAEEAARRVDVPGGRHGVAAEWSVGKKVEERRERADPLDVLGSRA